LGEGGLLPSDETPVAEVDTLMAELRRTPHTKDLHMVERWKLLDGGNAIEATVTFDDHGAFKRAVVGYGALEQNERANIGIGLRGEQRELPEYPRAIGISHAGGKDVGLLIGPWPVARKKERSGSPASRSRRGNARHLVIPDAQMTARVQIL